MKVLLSAVAMFGAVLATPAEYRVWTSADGATVIAEFQSRSGDKVLLETADGRTLNVPFDRLSPDDRKYAELHTPPRLAVEVDPNENHVSDSVLQRAGEGYIILDFTVTVRKRSSMSYSHPLRLDLYVVGVQEMAGHYTILQHVSSRIFFTGKTSKRIIRADQLLLKQTPEEKSSESDYEGYLLVITDDRDEQLVVQSNRKAFEKNTALFTGGKKGMTFSRRDLKGD